jgi:hypothetical protein
MTQTRIDRSLRQMRARFLRPWYRRALPWGIFGLGLLIVARIAFTPLVAGWTRARLGHLTSFRAGVRDVEIFSFPPVYVLDGLTVDPGDGRPVLSIERVEVHTTWRQILGAVVLARPATVRVRVARPRLVLAGNTPVQLAEELRQLLAGMPALHVELGRIEDGEILQAVERAASAGQAGGVHVETWLAKVDAMMESFGPPGVTPLAIKGTAALFGSGDTSFDIAMPSPAADLATGHLEVRRLSLADLALFVDGWAPRRAQLGTVAMAARFVLDGGGLQGILATSTNGIDLADMPRGLEQRLKERLSGASPWIAAQRRPASHERTFVQGTLSPPGAETWVQTLTAGRALFVEGLSVALPASAAVAAHGREATP